MQLAAFSAPSVKAALAAANVRLVFIGSGSRNQAGQFVESLKFPSGLPGEMLLDPTTAAYGAFGLTKSIYASLVPSIVNGMHTHGLAAVGEGIRLGWKNAALAGDSWQQGGMFLLEAPDMQPGIPVVRFGQRERWPGDWLPMAEIMQAAGATLQGDGGGEKEEEVGDGSVDYAAALRWYMALPPLEGENKVGPASMAKRATVVAAGVVAVGCVVLLIGLPMLGLLGWVGLQTAEAEEVELRRALLVL